MSLLSQWLREAPREEHRPAAVAGIVALALVAWALVPIGHDAVTAGLADAPGVESEGLTANPNTAGQPDVGATDVAGGAVGAGSNSAQPLSGSPRGPGGVAVPGGAGPGGAGSGTTQGPGGGLTTPATGGATCTSPLTASDQGITPTTVTIGVATFDAGDPAVTQQFGFRPDAEDVVNALVDDINSRGGLACRKLVVRYYKVNFFEENNQRAKCVEAARDDRVFAFLDPGSLTTLATQSCVTVENRVPLLNGSAWPASYVQAQAPYYLSPNTDANRASRDWVLRAKQAGFFDASNGFKKLGLLRCDDDGGIADEIRRTLAAVGVPSTAIDEQKLNCRANLSAPPNEIAQAALRHKLAGVTHVFPATLNLNVEVYLRAATSQDFKPKYSASDIGGLTYPGFTEAFDAAQWNGTVGYTSSRSGELRNGQPSPEVLRCDAVLRAKGVPGGGIKSEWDDFPGLYCDLLKFFTVGMSRVPANPTRLQFTTAVQTSGRIDFSRISDGIYDRPGKFTGADFFRTIQWRDDDIPACEKGDFRGSGRSNGCWFVLDPTFQPSN